MTIRAPDLSARLPCPKTLLPPCARVKLMTKEPAHIRNLRDLRRADIEFKHLDALEEELYASSDRATAILFGSFLETFLEHLLVKKVRDDLDSNDRRKLFEIIQSFSSKIFVAYALNLIGPTTRADLDLVRFLRNEFAHSRMPLSFKTPEVKSICDELKIVDFPTSIIPPAYLRRVSNEALKSAITTTDPKTRFVTTCHHLLNRMVVAIHGPREGDQVYENDDPLP